MAYDMKHADRPSVEVAYVAPHLSDMYKIYSFDGFFDGLPTLTLDGTRDGYSALGGSAFITGLQEGLAAPVMVFSTPLYEYRSLPTLAQCFGAVGTALSEAMTVIRDDERSRAAAKKAEAA